MNSKRPQVQRVSKPVARYRPGKVPHLPPGAAGDPYDYGSDEDEIHDDSRAERGLAEHAGESADKAQLAAAVQPPAQGGAEDGSSSEYETDTDAEAEDAAAPVLFKPTFHPKGMARPASAGAAVLAPSASVASRPSAPVASAESSSEYDTESEDEDESQESEPERPPQPVFRPSFVSKAQRATLDVDPTDADAEATKAESERARRKKEAHDLAAARIKAGLLEAEAAQQAEHPELSDTDGRDPEGEFAAWRERELRRLARARETEAAQKEHDAELVRRAALTPAERDAEDLARAQQTRKDKVSSRLAVGFMQKYRHKGAFFQDMDILRREVGPTENEVDKSTLPQIMQVRDFGRKGRSKWTHLAAEDTTRQQPDLRYRPPRRRDLGRDGYRDGQGSDAGSAAPATTGANSYSQRPTRTWGQGSARPHSPVPQPSFRKDEDDGKNRPGPAPPDAEEKPKKAGSGNRLRMKVDSRPRRKAGEYDLDDQDDRAPVPARPSHKERGPEQPERPRDGALDNGSSAGYRAQREQGYDRHRRSGLPRDASRPREDRFGRGWSDRKRQRTEYDL